MKNLLTTFLKKDASGYSHARLNWLTELNQIDEIASIKLSIHHITTIPNDPKLTLPEKINILIAIEDANEAAVHMQTTQFVKADYLSAQVADNIINNHYAYHRILFLAYTKLFAISYGRPSDQQPSKHLKLTIVTRALIAAANMLKWRYFEHATAPANLWEQVNAIYQRADEDMLCNQLTKPFKHLPSTTITSLFLQLHMFGSLNFSNLLKQHLDVIAQLLQSWMSEVRVKKNIEPYHLFYIDLNKDHPANRIRKKHPEGQCLFWDLDEIEYIINDYVQSLKSNKTPHALQQIEAKNTQIINEALCFLKNEWSKDNYKRQRRKEPRLKTERVVTVTIGINNICELLKLSNLTTHSARSMLDGTLNDRRLATSVVMRGDTNTLTIGKEKWTVLDESNSGLGSLISQRNAPNIKPNKLVAILSKNENTKPTLNLVRNIRQMSGGQLKIGMEIYTDNPTLISLKKLDLRKEKDVHPHTPPIISHLNFLAIYIPQNIMLERAASFILPKADFIPNAFYEILFKNKREIVKLQSPIESGDDWVRLDFPEELK